MAPKDLEILQHSLGVDQYGQGRMFRNHFVGGEKECRLLVASGYMTEHPASELTGGDPWFRVTEAGKREVIEQSPKPPKLTRSQQRYRRFLNDDSGLSFKEWLTWEKSRADTAKAGI